MWTLVGRLPCAQDLHPRHLTKYEKLALENPGYFAECADQIKLLDDHRGFVLRGQLPFSIPADVKEGKLLDDPPFFLEAYNTIFNCNSVFHGGSPSPTGVLAQFGLEGDSDGGGSGFNCDFGDNDDNESLGPLKKKNINVYYPVALEKFKTTCRYLNSDEKKAWYLEELSKLHVKAMQSCVSQSEHNKNKNANLVSLPSFDTSRKSKRIGSPNRKKGKKILRMNLPLHKSVENK